MSYISAFKAPSFGDADPIFMLRSCAHTLVAYGTRSIVNESSLPHCAKSAADFFARHGNENFLCGALPFGRDEPVTLFAPLRVERAMPYLAPLNIGDASQCTITPEPTAQAYGRAVAQSLKAFDAQKTDRQGLRKVVLARSLVVNCGRPVSPFALAAKLAQDAGVTAFSTLLAAHSGAAAPFLVGATPELLVSKRGQSVLSHPMAGTTRRHADKSRDEAAASGLLASDKNRREHAMVVEAVADALNPFCAELTVPDAPSLAATATLWHLGTRIKGTLRDRHVSSLELAAALHPTPAICGLPRDRAADFIKAHETIARGHYAGAVGYTDNQGNGEWHVALRCAEISGQNMRLFAGAGIVPGSRPEAEIAETSGKFLAMLTALGLSEDARLLSEASA